MGRARDVASLVAGLREGDAGSVARLISLVEGGSAQLPEVAAALNPLAGSARVIGITGAPGVGKSTTTAAIVSRLRERQRRVGVLAVDPSSPFSGGALLGDRIRMQQHANDPEVFIRSMASRGHLGGVAAATPQAVRVLDAAGCDDVLVETVGVGQSEVEVASLADTTIVVLAPGMGDGVQAAKAGILEVADIFVVNKADREGADLAVRELRAMITHGRRDGGEQQREWRQPVLKAVATTGEGIDDIVTAIDDHQQWAAQHGRRDDRRRRRHAAEIEALAWQRLHARWFASGQPTGEMGEVADAVRSGELDPYSAADRLLD